MAEITRTSSSEQKLSISRQFPDQNPGTSMPSSTAKGWCQNPKIQFPFKKQQSVKFWPGYEGTYPNQDVTCGDTVGSGSFNGHSGEVHCKDHYNSDTSSHNVVWCCTWDPYPFPVKGISFDWETYTSGVSWGFGQMWMMYLDIDGNKSFAEVIPNWGSDPTGEHKSKNPYGNEYKFSKKYHGGSKDDDIQDVSNGGTRAQFQGGHIQTKYNQRYCVGWAGFYTIMRRASVNKEHGFKFSNFYLLPDRYMYASDRWVTGKCDTLSNFRKGEKRLLLQDP